MPIDEVGELIPDPEVAKDLSVTLMTMWRWDHDEEMAALGWPPPIRVKKRKYRGSKLYGQFKVELLRRAIAHRQKSGASAGAPQTAEAT